MDNSELVVKDSASFNDMIRFYIVTNESTHAPILNDKNVQEVANKIYQVCLKNPDLIPAFEHELSSYGYTLVWLKDTVNPEEDLIVGINTPYGMASMYSNKQAFAEVGEEIRANRDLVNQYIDAESTGDEIGMAQAKKLFARRLRNRQMLYFLITPFHAMLLGIRKIIRIFKR